MSHKKPARQRRAKKLRFQIRALGQPRLCINRSSQHIYAQVISGDGGVVIASASTLEKGLDISATGNQEAASEIGKRIAERAKEKGIKSVAFDRSGFKYHGRVRALANAAREAGLEF
ncbi:MAG: 50S ribosomal protein L18 [Pseudomonadales bacterium]|nr:50S ribosomal protein L18 [Pseudomonadales bacterium]